MIFGWLQNTHHSLLLDALLLSLTHQYLCSAFAFGSSFTPLIGMFIIRYIFLHSPGFSIVSLHWELPLRIPFSIIIYPHFIKYIYHIFVNVFSVWHIHIRSIQPLSSSRLMFAQHYCCLSRQHNFSPRTYFTLRQKCKCILTNTYDGSIKMIHYLINMRRNVNGFYGIFHWCALIYTVLPSKSHHKTSENFSYRNAFTHRHHQQQRPNINIQR